MDPSAVVLFVWLGVVVVFVDCGFGVAFVAQEGLLIQSFCDKVSALVGLRCIASFCPDVSSIVCFAVVLLCCFGSLGLVVVGSGCVVFGWLILMKSSSSSST